MKVWAVILLTATAVIAPFVSVGYRLGGDVAFHAGLWFETARQWHEGVVYARWFGHSMFGYGDPSLLFYPSLSRILGGALVACLPSWTALGAYAWLGLVLGGFSFFYLCRKFLDDSSSLAAAFAYVINPYNLVALYVRFALAEFLVGMLFPLFMLAILRLGSKGKGKGSVALLALIIACVWLTNIPTAVVVNYTGALAVLALAIARRSKSVLGLFAIAEVLGAGLAAFYMLPAWHQQRWINMTEALGGNPLDHAFFASAAHNGPILNAGFLWQAAVGWLAWIYARKFRGQRRDVSVALTTILAASMLMCLPVSAFVWRHAPLLLYVKDATRWLLPLNLSATFFLGSALSGCEKRRWTAVAACACSLFLILSRGSARKDTVDWEELATPFQSGAETGLTETEYVPLPNDEISGSSPDFPQLIKPRFVFLNQDGKLSQSSGGRQVSSKPTKRGTISIQSWKSESRVLTVDTPEPARVRVRLLYFPGWHVLVNGRELQPVEKDDHDTVVVSFPVGSTWYQFVFRNMPGVVVPVPSGRSRVQLEFQNTPDEIWGMIISGLVAIVVGALCLAELAVPGRNPSGNMDEHSSQPRNIL